MDVDLALKLAQELRGVILKGFQEDQDKEAYEKSDKSISDFFKEENGTDVSTTDILAQIDAIIYSLMSYNPDEDDGWREADDFESKEMMKLKEIMK